MYNVLCIHKNPDKGLNLVHGDLHPKDPPVCPRMYLGSDIGKFVISNDANGFTCWVMSADIHVKKSLQVFEAKLK